MKNVILHLYWGETVSSFENQFWFPGKIKGNCSVSDISFHEFSPGIFRKFLSKKPCLIKKKHQTVLIFVKISWSDFHGMEQNAKFDRSVVVCKSRKIDLQFHGRYAAFSLEDENVWLRKIWTICIFWPLWSTMFPMQWFCPMLKKWMIFHN